MPASSLRIEDLNEGILGGLDSSSESEISLDVSAWKKQLDAFVREHVKGEVVEEAGGQQEATKLDAAKNIGISGLGVLASVGGAKAFLDVPRYLSQKYFTNQDKERILSVMESVATRPARVHEQMQDVIESKLEQARFLAHQMLQDKSSDQNLHFSKDVESIGADLFASPALYQTLKDELAEQMTDVDANSSLSPQEKREQKNIIDQERKILDTALEEELIHRQYLQRRDVSNPIVLQDAYQKFVADFEEQKKTSFQEDVTFADVKTAIDSSPYLTAEKKSALLSRVQPMLKKIWEEDRFADEDEMKELAAVLDDAIETRVKGVVALKESLNTLSLASGLFAARGLVYGGLSLVERAQRIAKEKRSEEKEWNFSEQLHDVFVKGFQETMDDLSFQGEGGTWRKIGKATQALGTVARVLGIGGVAVAEYVDESRISTSIDTMLDAWEKKPTGQFVADNFKSNIDRLIDLWHTGKKVIGSALISEAAAAEPLHTESVPAMEFTVEEIKDLDAKAEKILKMTDSKTATLMSTPKEGEISLSVGDVTITKVPDVQADMARAAGVASAVATHTEAGVAREMASSVQQFEKHHGLLNKYGDVKLEGEKMMVEVGIGKGEKLKYLDQALRRVVMDVMPPEALKGELTAVDAARAETLVYKLSKLAHGNNVMGEKAKEWADCLEYKKGSSFRITDYARFEKRVGELWEKAEAQVNEKSLMMAYVDNTGQRVWQDMVDEKIGAENVVFVSNFSEDANVTVAEQKVFEGMFPSKDYFTYDLQSILSDADEDSGSFMFDGNKVLVQDGWITGVENGETLEEPVFAYDTQAVKDFLNSLGSGQKLEQKFDLDSITDSETKEVEKVVFPGMNVDEKDWKAYAKMIVRDFVHEYEKGQLPVVLHPREMRIAEYMKDLHLTKAEAGMTMQALLEKKKDLLNQVYYFSQDKYHALLDVSKILNNSAAGETTKGMFLKDVMGIDPKEIESLGTLNKEGGKIIFEGVKLKGGAAGDTTIVIDPKSWSIRVDTPGWSPDRMPLNDKNLEKAADIIRESAKKVTTSFEQAQEENAPII